MWTERKYIVNHDVIVFYDSSVWVLMIQIFILGLALLAGNIIRTRVPGLRRFLIPSALLGGLVIVVLKFIPAFSSLVNVEIMQMITYHCLGLGFVAISLKETERSRKVPAVKIVENGCMTGATYILQGITGVAISLVLYRIFGTFYSAGYILPMGFGQGPGSALSWGAIYEAEYGFAGGASFGLTVASIGFAVASVVGVVYMNIQISKGRIIPRKDEGHTKSVEDFEKRDEIPTSESIDRFSMQIVLVIISYAGAYGIMNLISASGIKALQDLAWGLNFLWAIIAAYILKIIMKRLKAAGTVKRGYVNNYLLDRFGGFMFDLMIIAGVASIRFEDVRINWLAIVLMCTAASAVTFFYVRSITKHLYRGYENEMFLCNFGMLTGTVSNGMILLREIDPNYRTPAASNQVMQNFPAILFAAPCLLLMGTAASSLRACLIVLGIFTVLFASYTIFLFRRKVFRKRYQDKQDYEWKES